MDRGKDIQWISLVGKVFGHQKNIFHHLLRLLENLMVDALEEIVFMLATFIYCYLKSVVDMATAERQNGY